MKIINSEEIKSTNIDSEVFLKINLNAENLTKIPLQILYYNEHGIKNYILSYNYDSFKVPITKVVEKLKIDNLFQLVKEYGIKIYFSGFPMCVFERDILRPGMRWYYEGSVLDYNFEYDNANHSQCENCADCMFSNGCCGVSDEYITTFKDSEFIPLIANKDLYDLNLETVEKFKSEKLKDIAKIILKDYRDDIYYMRKRFVFVKSYPNTLDESAKERFVYYIYNRDDDFEKTYDLLSTFFAENFLKSIIEYLKKSNQIVLSFGFMGDNTIRKTLYFNIDDLNDYDLGGLSSVLGIRIEGGSLWGVGVDFRGTDRSYKVYYEQNKVTSQDIKNFMSDIPLENKRKSLKFANSLIKPVSNVLLDYKFKDEVLYSKRIDISMQYNKFRNNQIGLLFGINMNYFEDKDIYTMIIEAKEGDEEKINFYYALKLPEEEEERDFSTEQKNYYNRY
jgi:hypothetical protein